MEKRWLRRARKTGPGLSDCLGGPRAAAQPSRTLVKGQTVGLQTAGDGRPQQGVDSVPRNHDLPVPARV